MRRWGIVAVVIAACLTGCGPSEAEAKYLRSIKSLFAEAGGETDEDLLRYGKHYCSALKTLKDPVPALLSVNLNEGASMDLLAPVAATAGQHLCPELKS